MLPGKIAETGTRIPLVTVPANCFHQGNVAKPAEAPALVVLGLVYGGLNFAFFEFGAPYTHP